MKKTRIDTVDFRYGLTQIYTVPTCRDSIPPTRKLRRINLCVFCVLVANPDEIGTVAKPLFVRGYKLKNLVLLCSCALVLFLAGCKDDDREKALAEAAQAKIEIVKARAEVVQLKGEAGYLRGKLQTAEQARDKLREQLDRLLEEQDATVTEAQDAQQEIDNLKEALAEQSKKAGELEKQVEQLKAIIRELQTKIEQQTALQQQAVNEANEPQAGG